MWLQDFLNAVFSGKTLAQLTTIKVGFYLFVVLLLFLSLWLLWVFTLFVVRVFVAILVKGSIFLAIRGDLVFPILEG